MSRVKRYFTTGSAHGTTPNTDVIVNDPIVLASTVDMVGVELKVYVYIDGDNSTVTSDNAANSANMTGIDIEINFYSAP